MMRKRPGRMNNITVTMNKNERLRGRVLIVNLVSNRQMVIIREVEVEIGMVPEGELAVEEVEVAGAEEVGDSSITATRLVRHSISKCSSRSIIINHLHPISSNLISIRLNK